MPNLAELIGRATPTAPLKLRQATVVGTPAGGVATIRLGGATETEDDIAGVHCLTSVVLADGDAVQVLQQGGVLLVIGKVGVPGSRVLQESVLRPGTTALPDDNVEYQISTTDITLSYATAVFVTFTAMIVTEAAVAGNYDGRLTVRLDGNVVNPLNTQWFITADGGNREWISPSAAAFVNAGPGTVTFSLHGMNVTGSSGDVNVQDVQFTVQELSR